VMTVAQPIAERIGRGLRQILVALWDPVATVLADFYRPEKHYMRGPGPKSRARQASVRSINEDV
jgi:hypothetical protein